MFSGHDYFKSAWSPPKLYIYSSLIHVKVTWVAAAHLCINLMVLFCSHLLNNSVANYYLQDSEITFTHVDLHFHIFESDFWQRPLWNRENALTVFAQMIIIVAELWLPSLLCHLLLLNLEILLQSLILFKADVYFLSDLQKCVM